MGDAPRVSLHSVSFPVRHRCMGDAPSVSLHCVILSATQMHGRCTKCLPALCVIPSATQEQDQVSRCSVIFPVRHRAGRYFVHLPCICVALGTTQSAGSPRTPFYLFKLLRWKNHKFFYTF